MAYHSAKKKDMTPLEIEAQNLVRHEDMFDDNDRPDVEEMIEKKKARRAGEGLHDYLERQTKNQIRETLGYQFKELPPSMMNRLTKNEALKALKKRDMNANRTPGKDKTNRGERG